MYSEYVGDTWMAENKIKWKPFAIIKDVLKAKLEKTLNANNTI